MRYKGNPNNPKQAIGLLGKGITFDTGGISLKPADRMEEMKGDMAGAASVIAAISAIAQLKAKVNVTSIAAATENMPGGGAQRPGDIVKTMGGRTIEVVNTDAEGRLILADAVSYACKLGLSPIVDVATLTGACVIALGNITTGVLGNDQKVVEDIIVAGRVAGEKMWQLPTFDEYKEQYKSNVADIKNIGGRPAGAITGAMIIGEFTGDTPWVHLDIAGTSFTDKDSGYHVKGGTGVPVRTLVHFVLGAARS
jgi:leucyl aminopeptidase